MFQFGDELFILDSDVAETDAHDPARRVLTPDPGRRFDAVVRMFSIRNRTQSPGYMRMIVHRALSLVQDYCFLADTTPG
ncbi:hypothetical protein [Microbacterium sp. JZ31]|uniref:hypothetical protein n=1 Tax=Microbacterium sp. JZ31 TaxID=1906274 RepID=UPI001933031F|nr:hypothetical protein [Microbacterium sp. JZ31]